MSDADWGMQKAIYARLAADDGLKSLIGDPARIYDDAPPDAPFPFLQIGEGRTRDYPGVDAAVEHDIRIYAFSRYAGRKEVKRMMSCVYDSLHEQAFAVTGRKLVSIRYVFGDVWRRQDGDTYQGVMRYRAVTEPEA